MIPQSVRSFLEWPLASGGQRGGCALASERASERARGFAFGFASQFAPLCARARASASASASQSALARALARAAHCGSLQSAQAECGDTDATPSRAQNACTAVREQQLAHREHSNQRRLC